MSKSIETIWQDGFIDDMSLEAPKINNLYNQKSQNLIDKFEYMFEANHKAIVIAAFVFAGGLSFFGAPILGALIALMLCGLVYVGKQQMKAFKTIDKGNNSFEYLQSFDTWLDSAIEQYVKIYRFFYPTLFAICAIRFAYSDVAQSFLSKVNLLQENGQVSIAVFVAIGLISLMLGFAGGFIYRADVNLVYGNEIKKLKELIAEMRTLRQDLK